MEHSLLKRITINPDICHGKPTIRNKRYTVDLILDLLSSGMTEEDILACLAYASQITKTKTYVKTM